MSEMIHIGDRARTRGPLKPSGQISVGELTLTAVSSGEWIDAGKEVESIGGNRDRVHVRHYSGEQAQLENHGQPLTERQQETVEPLEAPPAWVEKINPVKIGVIAGAAIGMVVWLQDVPFSPSALSVPLAGVICGWMFRRLVAIPAEAAGPRADHRPLAIGIAFLVCISTFVGAIIGFNVSGTFLGTSLGLVIGTVTAGITILVLFLFS